MRHLEFIDLSELQIAAGLKQVAAQRLSNIELKVGDITALGELGTFDFVIAHGVFSWVPRAVQEGLFRTVRGCLSEQGVAFTSYTSLPGAYPRQALREMLLWHVKADVDPATRVEKARPFAEFVAANASKKAPHLAAIRRLVSKGAGEGFLPTDRSAPCLPLLDRSRSYGEL